MFTHDRECLLVGVEVSRHEIADYDCTVLVREDGPCGVDDDSVVMRIIGLVVAGEVHDGLGNLQDDMFDVVLKQDCIGWHLIRNGREVVIKIVDLIEKVVITGMRSKIDYQLSVIFCAFFRFSYRSVICKDQVVLLIADYFYELAVWPFV